MTDITIIEYGEVELKRLKPYPKNPRKGDINIIAQSLKVNGQYRPIVVNKRTMEIVAGNHTFKAAQQLKWKKIAVGYIDVDEPTARKIMLADNRSNDAATYDYELLAEVIAEVDDVSGTGYSDEDRESLLHLLQEGSEGLSEALSEIQTTPLDLLRQRTSEERAMDDTAGVHGASGMMNPSPGDDETIESLDDVSSELEGVLELKQDMIFPIENDWGIPKLLSKKLVKRLPEPLTTWAGKDVTPDDGVSWYLYNYGVDSATELPWDRAILSFYTHDIHFENWWRIPAHYAAKVINADLEMAITPNFTLFDDDPPILTVWSIYRSFWMARYLQEAGINVIPDIRFAAATGSAKFTEKEMNRIATIGIPKNPPVVALQVQNVRPHEKEKIRYQQRQFAQSLELVEPQHILVYGAKTGHKLIEDLKLGIPLTKLFNRAHIRRGVVFDQKKGYDITTMGQEEEPDYEATKRPERRKTQNPHSYGTTLHH